MTPWSDNSKNRTVLLTFHSEATESSPIPSSPILNNPAISPTPTRCDPSHKAQHALVPLTSPTTSLESEHTKRPHSPHPAQLLFAFPISPLIPHPPLPVFFLLQVSTPKPVLVLPSFPPLNLDDQKQVLLRSEWLSTQLDLLLIKIWSVILDFCIKNGQWLAVTLTLPHTHCIHACAH